MKSGCSLCMEEIRKRVVFLYTGAYNYFIVVEGGF
jgi:hypothetical protein